MSDSIELFHNFFSQLAANLISDEESSCLDMTDEADLIIAPADSEDYADTFEKACHIVYKIQRYNKL